MFLFNDTATTEIYPRCLHSSLPNFPLVWENIYMTWGSHMSNFHGVTQYGSKIHHTTMTGVTCDTMSLMRLQNAHNLCNPVPSWLMTKRNTKLRKSWTPGSGGVNYGTWLSSSGGHTQITCGSLMQMSMPQLL